MRCAHTCRRSPPGVVPRPCRVDPTASIDIGFTIALVAALRADPVATRRALLDVDFAGAPAWAAHLANGCAVLEGWAATMLGDREGPGRALAALDAARPGSGHADDPAGVSHLRR